MSTYHSSRDDRMIILYGGRVDDVRCSHTVGDYLGLQYHVEDKRHELEFERIFLFSDRSTFSNQFSSRVLYNSTDAELIHQYIGNDAK